MTRPMTDDIVDTLRRNPLYIPTSRINSFGRPQMGFELTSFNLIAADEIERLRKERDEARKLYCEQMSNISRQQDCTPQWFAEEMNWDCFKDASDDR